MEGPRPPLETEFKNVVQFLDEELRANVAWSISAEYPNALSESNRGNMRIIKAGDQVLSHALLRPMIVKSPVGLLKVAGIGSVVTSSEHRNQGLSTKIIESCLVEARAQGCDFAILWTNLYDFYRKMGFELAGSEISIVIDHELNANENGLKFLESNKVSAEAIHRVFSKHTVTSMRTVDEIQRNLQIPNSRVYTAWDAQQQLAAYAIEGKGADLDGYIHEWGGGVAALTSLFSHIHKTQKRPVTVIIPRHSQNLLNGLREKGCEPVDGFLGMIKLLQCGNLFSKIQRYARSLGVSDFILEKQGEEYVFGVGQNVYKTSHERDIVKLLFGPQNASQIHYFAPATAATLEKVLPISMWVWGWDSV